MEDINLTERTIHWMARKQFRSKGRGTFWPSEASAQFTNQFNEVETVGKCKRATFYRLKGLKPTNPPSSKSQVIFLLGNLIEDQLVEMWKQMGLWENNSVRWEDKEKNLSGEFDCILREGNRLYGVECKSFYGYHANKQILGYWEGRAPNKRFIYGRPKDEHLMQAAIYADQTRGQLEGFKIFYCSRDNNEFKEFNITTTEDGTIFINGRAETRFTMNDVYSRYTQLQQHLDEESIPDKDYTYKPDDATVQKLFERGDVSKSAYEAHVAGKESYTDFHCSYCEYKDHCQGPNSNSFVNPQVEVPVQEIDYLMQGGL